MRADPFFDRRGEFLWTFSGLGEWRCEHGPYVASVTRISLDPDTYQCTVSRGGEVLAVDVFLGRDEGRAWCETKIQERTRTA